MKYLCVQLKVCEGCGSLWFRTQMTTKVYCEPCARKLAMHAKARPEQRRGRRPGHTGAGCMAGGGR